MPNSVKTKVNSLGGRPPDELPISDVARDPNMNSVVPGNGKPKATKAVTFDEATDFSPKKSPSGAPVPPQQSVASTKSIWDDDLCDQHIGTQSLVRKTFYDGIDDALYR